MDQGKLLSDYPSVEELTTKSFLTSDEQRRLEKLWADHLLAFLKREGECEEHLFGLPGSVEWPENNRIRFVVPIRHSKELLGLEGRIPKIKTCVRDVATVRILEAYDLKNIRFEIEFSFTSKGNLRSALQSQEWCQAPFEFPVAFGVSDEGMAIVRDLMEISPLVVIAGDDYQLDKAILYIRGSLIYSRQRQELKTLTALSHSGLHLKNSYWYRRAFGIVQGRGVIKTLEALEEEASRRRKLFESENVRSVREYNQVAADGRSLPATLGIIERIDSIGRCRDLGELAKRCDSYKDFSKLGISIVFTAFTSGKSYLSNGRGAFKSSLSFRGSHLRDYMAVDSRQTAESLDPQMFVFHTRNESSPTVGRMGLGLGRKTEEAFNKVENYWGERSRTKS